MVKKTLIIFTALFVTLCFNVSGFTEELTPQLAKAKVIAATKLIGAEGEAAFAKIKDPEGEFRFADGQGYIWIQDLNAVVLMHPIKPSLDGKDMSGFADKNGTLLFLNFSDICEEKGAGWVPYVWPKPGQDGTSPKISYVKLVKHGGKNYVAGAGMYDVTPADIKKQFPGDAIYEE
ncbi:MAG: cache domain-containing protein [Desulfobacula sp.]|nr:cache domain-containing protein [Desulfobacula sp.]